MTETAPDSMQVDIHVTEPSANSLLTLSHAYVPIPVGVILADNVSSGAVRLYAIAFVHSRGLGSCSLSQEYLAEKLGVDPRTVRRYLRELVGLGWFTKSRRGVGAVNCYRIIGPVPSRSVENDLSIPDIHAGDVRNGSVENADAVMILDSKTQSNSNPVDPLENQDLGLRALSTALVPENLDSNTRIIAEADGKKTTMRKPRARDLLFDAIAEVCKVDPRTGGSSIGKIKATLQAAGYGPGDVIAFGKWWWDDDFRRRRMIPPTIWQLQERIAVVRAVAHEPDRNDPDQVSLRNLLLNYHRPEVIASMFNADRLRHLMTLLPETKREEIDPYVNAAVRASQAGSQGPGEIRRAGDDLGP